MGLLDEGTALTWEETKKLCEHVRYNGVSQFINIYNRNKDRIDTFKWGEEIEYMLVKLLPSEAKARVLLQGQHVLKDLKNKALIDATFKETSWMPEFTEYQLESTPGKPYDASFSELCRVEENLKLRRRQAMSVLDREHGEVLLSFTSFPRSGCRNFTYPKSGNDNRNSVYSSPCFPYQTVGRHPRYSNFLKNVPLRKGERVNIKMPVFRDEKTSWTINDKKQSANAADINDKNSANFIHADSVGTGFGCSCLQITFQGKNMNEARYLYDQLTCIAPILPKNPNYISKSRYSSVNCFLSRDGAKYNDVPLQYHLESYERLKHAGVDEEIAKHVANLFIRDSISMFTEAIYQNNEIDSNHFENIQSTNWHHMRFKPPPPNSDIGWRVEFRPLDIQLTEFENAAFSVFVIVLTRTILHFNLNFLMPLSKVDENMDKAQKRGAALNEKFHFRKNFIPGNADIEISSFSNQTKCMLEEMTANEILNGNARGFRGLVPLMREYLASVQNSDEKLSGQIHEYLTFMQQRADGTIKTGASWMRDYVRAHPEYQRDSVVNERINYDLMKECHEISMKAYHATTYDDKTMHLTASGQTKYS